MIPRTLFTSEHDLFRSSVRKFLETEAVPFHEQWEKEGKRGGVMRFAQLVNEFRDDSGTLIATQTSTLLETAKRGA